MKKIFTLLLILFACNTVIAQNKNDVNTKPSTQLQQVDSKRYNDLHKMLVQQFGTNYSLQSEAVKQQLLNNVSNPSVSYTIKKMSLIALYGNDAPKYAHLIRQ